MSINPSPVLSFRQATINNGEENVIFDVNMKVYPGELVYIIGKVGGGKTSFARTVTAENQLEEGSGRIHNSPLYRHISSCQLSSRILRKRRYLGHPLDCAWRQCPPQFIVTLSSDRCSRI